MFRAGLKQFLGLSSFEMLAMFRRGLFYAYLSIYLRHYLGLSVTETTLFATLPMGLNILSQTFIWGKISDRFQLRRSLIITGEALAGIGTLAIWYVHRMFEAPKSAGYAIIIGLTVIEIFWAMSNIAWSALVSDIYTAKDRGQVLGRLSSMGGIGRMMGVWCGGLLYDGLGRMYAGWGFYEGPLFFISAGVMFISITPLLFLPEGGIDLQPGADNTGTGQKSAGAPASAAVYIVFLTGMIFINFGRNSIAIIFPQYLTLEEGLAIDSRTLSYIINLQSLAIVLFGWISGWIGRKAGNANALLAATVVSIVGLAILVWFTALPMFYLSSFIRGVADVIILSTAYAYASILIPPQFRAQRFAWFNATFFLSWGLAGTLITGPVVDLMIAAGGSAAWAYRLSFATAGIVTLIGLIIMSAMVVYRRRKHRGKIMVRR